MLSEARQKNYGKIKQGPKMLNFGVSKPRVKGGAGPRPPDPHLTKIDGFRGLRV